MKKIAPFIAVLTVTALFPGCGGGNGVRFSDLFDQSASAEGTGIQFTGVVRAVVILATHDATAHQRQVAEQNGRRAVAKLKARLAASERETTPASHEKATHHDTEPNAPKPKTTGPTSETHQAEVKTQPHARSKALPRIIAIATEKDDHTDKKAARAVMLFDTHSEQIIGNKVYDIESEPKPGEDVRFETQSTSYIGASL